MNNEPPSANESETHTHGWGLGEVGRPFHDLEKSQTSDSIALQG